VSFDALSLVLHDPATNVMRLHVLVTSVSLAFPFTMDLSPDDDPAGLVPVLNYHRVLPSIDDPNRTISPTSIRKIITSQNTSSICNWARAARHFVSISPRRYLDWVNGVPLKVGFDEHVLNRTSTRLCRPFLCRKPVSDLPRGVFEGAEPMCNFFFHKRLRQAQTGRPVERKSPGRRDRILK
jgi:hypothetical protein